MSRHDRWAMIGGQLVVHPQASGPPYWVRNVALNQLYLSAHHISPRSASDYAGALRSFGPTHLIVYPSAAAELARICLEAGWRLPRVEAVIANAEPVLPWQREVVAAAFGAPLRETYGSSESVVGASECPHGSLHLWPEAGVLEILDGEGRPAETGRVVATGLLNETMPLIRYELGDTATLGSPCACGRTLPTLRAVEGRTDDTFVTPDGRRVGRLDAVFKAEVPVVEAQLVQQAVDRIVVRVVPDRGYGSHTEDELRRAVRDRLGDVVVQFETTDRIPREPNGKFRMAKSVLDGGGKPGQVAIDADREGT